MTSEELNAQYRDITALYDIAESLAATVENPQVNAPETQLELVEPLITQIADATDILTEEYVAVLEKPARKKMSRSRVESALRKLFMAVEEYRLRAQEKAREGLAILSTIADPIIENIRKQVQKITIIFLQLMEISLDRIMQRNEADEFKRAHVVGIGSIQMS